jgi:DNA-binding SARP family transcriptional activator/TolB-like protein
MNEAVSAPSDRVPRIRLLGGLFLEVDGQRFAGPAAAARPLAILALLSAEHPGWVSRDRLSAWLWPDLSPRKARHRLSDCLYLLRGVLGPEAFLATGDDLRISPASATCDLWEFREALDRGALDEAVGLYGGPFVDGFLLGPADGFERWAELERSRLARSFAGALETLATEREAAGNLPEAVRWWRRLVDLDSLNGNAVHRLVRALEAAGQRAEALRIVGHHQDLLRTELDAEPDPEVLEAARRLRETPTPRPSPLPLPEPRAKGEPIGRAPVSPLRRRPARAYRVAILLALALMGSVATYRSLAVAGSPAQGEERVLVLPLENRTGDAGLDVVGDMAADWIVQGLSRARLPGVVPIAGTMAVSRAAGSQPGEGEGAERIRRLAEEAGASIVISGSLYLQRDSLRLQATVLEARRSRVLHAPAAVGTPVHLPLGGIQELGERVTGAMAMHVNPRAELSTAVPETPPSLESYRAWVEGQQLAIQRDWAAATVRFQEAIARDSTFLLPHLSLAWSYGNLGDHATVDSIVSVLSRSRDRLTPYHRASLEMLIALQGDDPVARYEAARRGARLGPGSPMQAQWGVEALRAMNRPGEAIEILSGIDPTGAGFRGGVLYWQFLTKAHHVLGDYRRELREARRARATHPDDPYALALEAVALAALGRLSHVRRLIDARMALPVERDPHPLALIVWIGDELRAHGHPDAANELYARGIAWYRARPTAEQANFDLWYGFALSGAGEWSRAEAVFRRLAEEDPWHPRTQGMLGMLAALRGDSAEARRIGGSLADGGGPSRAWARTYWRSCIEAQLGETEEAMALLREAFGQGASYHPHPHHGADYLPGPHVIPCLDPLRDEPAFVELMRPRG